MSLMEAACDEYNSVELPDLSGVFGADAPGLEECIVWEPWRRDLVCGGLLWLQGTLKLQTKDGPAILQADERTHIEHRWHASVAVIVQEVYRSIARKLAEGLHHIGGRFVPI